MRTDFKMQRYEKLIVVFLCLLVFLFSSTREKTIWRYKSLLTLKLFSENINFKKGSKTIMVGSDSQEFLEALESKQTVIKGVKIKSLLLSSNNSSEHPDVAFIDDMLYVPPPFIEFSCNPFPVAFPGKSFCTYN